MLIAKSGVTQRRRKHEEPLSWQFYSPVPSRPSAWPMPPTDAALVAIVHGTADASSMAGVPARPHGTSALPELGAALLEESACPRTGGRRPHECTQQRPAMALSIAVLCDARTYQRFASAVVASGFAMLGKTSD